MRKPRFVSTAIIYAVLLFFVGGIGISYASGDSHEHNSSREYRDGGKPYSLCDHWGNWLREFHFCKRGEDKGNGKNDDERRPQVYLFATRYSIKAGKSTTLYWDAKRADSCTAEGDGWDGDREVKAEEKVSPATTTIYTITCTNEFGSYTDSATITVKGKVPEEPPPPTDVCPNIEGVQEFVPDGYHEDNGECAPDVIPPTDVCPNIEGTQEVVPDGYHLDAGQCVEDQAEPPPPAIDHVVISEVYYDVAAEGKGSDPANEWIEVYNGTGSAVDMSNWVIADVSSEFDLIPEGIIIQNKSFIVFTASSTTSGFWGGVPMVSLETARLGNSLGNSGDTLYLKNIASTTIDAMSYGTVDPAVFTPTATDVADGHSLQRIDLTVDTDTAADWDDSGVPSPGS